MDLPSLSTSSTSRPLGFLVIIVFAPLAVVFGVIAASHLLQQFINGWIPSRWISPSIFDWMLGDGTQGAASNYIGFMLTGVPAAVFGKAVLWGYNKLTSKNQ